MINYPFEYDTAIEVFNNNESFPGGFFPVGENNFWHGGIHLKGTSNITNPFDNVIRPIANGEIIACRITKDYIEAELPEFIKSDILDHLGNTKNIVTNNYDPQYFQREKSAAVYKKKDTLNDEKKKIIDALSKFSNNFVLIRHMFQNSRGQKFTYYSLYMHLAPFKHFPQAGNEKIKSSTDNSNINEIVRPFYREWKIKVIDTAYHKCVILRYENGKKKNLIPGGTLIEEMPDEKHKWKDKKIKIKELNNGIYIKVKSYYLEKEKGNEADATGYVKLDEFLKQKYFKVIEKKRIYKLKKYTKVFYPTLDHMSLSSYIKGMIINDNGCKINDFKQMGNVFEVKIPYKNDVDNKDNFKIKQFRGFIYFSEVNFKKSTFNSKKGCKVLYDYVKLYDKKPPITPFFIQPKGEKGKYFFTSSISNENVTKNKVELNEDNLKKEIDYLEENGKIIVENCLLKDDFVEFIEQKNIDIKKLKKDNNNLMNNYFEVEKTYCDTSLKNKKIFIGYVKLDDLYIERGKVYKLLMKELDKLDNNKIAAIKDEIEKDNRSGVYVFNGNSSTSEVIGKIKEGSIIKVKNKFSSHEYLNENDTWLSIDMIGNKKMNGYIGASDSTRTKNRSSALEIVKGIDDNYKIKDDIQIFEEPIKVNSNEILGYPGRYLWQKNVFHFEVFMGNDKVKNIFKNRKTRRLDSRIGFIIEKVQYKITVIKKPIIKKAVKNDDKIEKSCILKVTEINNDDLVNGLTNYEEYNKACKISIERGPLINVWVMEDDPNYEYEYIFNEDKTEIYTRVDKDTFDITCYSECPTKHCDREKIRYKFKVRAYKGEISPVISRSAELKKTDEKYLEGYHQVQMHVEYTKKDNETRYLKISDFDDIGLKKLSNDSNLYILEKELDKWYIENPSEFRIKKEINYLFDTGKQYNSDQIMTAKGGKWIGFKIGAKGEEKEFAWIKMDEIEKMNNNINTNSNNYDKKKNKVKDIYHWCNFFTEIREQDTADMTNGLLDAVVINEKRNGVSYVLSTLDEGMLYREIKNNRNFAEDLRSLYCTHPTEWDKIIYETNTLDELKKNNKLKERYLLNEKDIQTLKKIYDKLYFWDKAKSSLPNDNTKLCFFHPATFIEHINRFTPFNPYYMKKPGWIDNPGFAVYELNGTINMPREGREFNADYTHHYRPKYTLFHHEGIDVSGTEGVARIRSLIYGKVVIVGNNGDSDYGKFVIVQDRSDNKKFYLMGHMYEQLVIKDDNVSPGQDIGIVGDTGNSGGAHMHLTVFIEPNENIWNIFIKKNDSNLNSYNFKLSEYKNFAVNPLDNNEKWKGYKK